MKSKRWLLVGLSLPFIDLLGGPFVVYKMTFAYFWNCRARRLRRHQE